MGGLNRAFAAAAALLALTAAAPAAGAAGGQPQGAEALRIGEGSAGELAQGDERLGSGEFVDQYRFTGRRGQRVAIELGSAAFDTYLILVRPDGQQVDNDDRSDRDGTDSRIETAIAQDGEYRILVTSFRPGESGRYRLELSESAGSAARRRCGWDGVCSR